MVSAEYVNQVLFTGIDIINIMEQYVKARRNIYFTKAELKQGRYLVARLPPDDPLRYLLQQDEVALDTVIDGISFFVEEYVVPVYEPYPFRRMGNTNDVLCSLSSDSLPVFIRWRAELVVEALIERGILVLQSPRTRYLSQAKVYSLLGWEVRLMVKHKYISYSHRYCFDPHRVVRENHGLVTRRRR